ncbi:MAG: hypothetical protein KGZ74_14480 [Chitinophagaceae bacterium]|nr:hypothetical protein [Chitinophagaceae bacterium]
MSKEKKVGKHSSLKLAVQIKSKLTDFAKGLDSKKLESRIEKYSNMLAEQIEKLQKKAGKKTKKAVSKRTKKTSSPSVKAAKK